VTATTTATIIPTVRLEHTEGGGGGRTRRMIGLIVVALLVLTILVVMVLPGAVARTNPITTGVEVLQAPSGSHWFGTDQLGRDVFSRTVYGARPVLVASVLGVLLATVAGVIIGIIGGAAPSWIRAVVMRVVDVLLALPVLLIALILIATVGAGIPSVVFALGAAFTPGFARVVESSVRRLRSVEYVEAARVFGSTGVRTSLRHLLPNLITEVVVLVSSAVGWAILTATTLSFLGLGVRLPAADWGSDLHAGSSSLSTSWWLSTFPGAAITVTILIANFAGDYVMTALDPRGGRRARHGLRAFIGRGGSTTKEDA